tara:strand:- start:3923 stop:5344 length:1422 start_codon:yes stop_codon:yes gene_type:complete
MLNKLRNFSKGKLAGVLVGIIIIPFVFWGMGSVFSGGNTNSIAKIDNHNVSTQNFADFINNSKISSEYISENIDNNILEELLTQLVSNTLVNLEIDELQIFISDQILAKKIKNQKSFQDDNNKFSRTKYEKFLLENRLTSIQFEQEIKQNELKKELFKYISGGIKSPLFLTNKTYNEQLKKIDINFFDLDSLYKSQNEFSLDELEKHVEENKEKFFIEKIDISLIKLTPNELSGENEFSDNFFSKIDEIEDLVSENINIEEISKKFNLRVRNIEKFHPGDNSEELLNEIYKKRNTQVIELLDKTDYFLLYEIKNLEKILPSLDSKEFQKKVRNDLFENLKYKINTDLMKKIQKKEFSNEDFLKLTDGVVNNLKISSIEDTSKFTRDSVILLYSLGINNFSLVSDTNNKIYLVKIENIYNDTINIDNEEIQKFVDQTNNMLRDNLYSSYDFLLNEKYDININANTLDRMKNYFK